MNVISIALAGHYGQGSTSLAQCWKCVRADGTVYGFTSTDVNLTFEGVVYEAATGFTPSANESKADMSVPNLEVAGILDSTSITEEDLLAGLWDGCEIELFEVNYRDLSMGKRTIGGGTIGNVTTGRQSFVAELRGIQQKLQQSIGALYSMTCRANLFSVTGQWRCGLIEADYQVLGTATSATGNRTFTDTSRGEANDYFQYGKVVWLTGDNAGLSMECKEYTAGVFTLHLQMPYAITAGDTYRATPGCNKIGRLGDCKLKFNNYPNFRGEEDVPGNDEIMKAATA